MPVRKENASARYNLTLKKILKVSASIFARKGYHNASIRDISRKTGISLSGLYYYFKTKEELLFLIAQNSFDSVLASAQSGLSRLTDPEEKLRFLVRNHLDYFVRNLNETKVLAHESDSLSGDNFALIQKKKRSYLDLLESLLKELNPGRRSRVDHRLAALALFGMMNWIYTWYHSKKDSDVDTLSETMSSIFIEGFRSL